MTFSIAARCAKTGRFGIAISSSSPAVAARCAHLKPGVGAVCSQNITDPRLGPAALELMAMGAPAHVALDVLCATRAHIDFRQLVAIGKDGRTAIFSGHKALGIVATAEGKDAAAAGNMLANDGVPAAMVAAFEASEGEDLGDRLISAMRAGVKQGGEAGPVHSAGLKMVGDVDFPIADLRVDWDETDPIGRLADIWQIYKPQLEAYIQRALDPAGSPGYGVPGDDR
jgi:uncharacterized Ntn-hydrolase superfamily protein